MMTKNLPFFLLAVLLVFGAGFLAWRNERTLIFSPSQLLQSTWLTYKDEHVEKGTYRTIDNARGDVTTSEGQSYTMLRAVWMGDKETFDGAWQWTQDNLFHTDDHLFAWIWGKRSNGTYGVLIDQNGENSASDADQDIALALIFAYSRWQDPTYLQSAHNIISDIWDKEVVDVNGTPYLAADNVEKNSTSPQIIINPSYLSPAAYRIFAQIDTAHPWNKVVDSSYLVLNQSMQANLGKTKTVSLPPDWIALNRTTGTISTPASGDSNFSFDAMRVPWRLALDWQWFADPRDKEILSNMSFLSSQWDSFESLASSFGHDGTVVNPNEAPSIWGGTIGYFVVADTKDAKQVYQKKLTALYNPGANTWNESLLYYDDNWAWFGIGLYNGLLPNLSSWLPKGALTVNE